jgi:hypothetical protein
MTEAQVRLDLKVKFGLLFRVLQNFFRYRIINLNEAPFPLRSHQVCDILVDRSLKAVGESSHGGCVKEEAPSHDDGDKVDEKLLHQKSLQWGGYDSVCLVNFGQGLYLDAAGGGGGGGGGEGGEVVSKFRFLKHSQVPNCVLELRKMCANVEGDCVSAPPPPQVLLCLVSLRRISPGTSLTVDFSQRQLPLYSTLSFALWCSGGVPVVPCCTCCLVLILGFFLVLLWLWLWWWWWRRWLWWWWWR